MANIKALKFGPVARFRLLEGDFEILRTAATKHGQTLSAYLREAAISRALEDLGVDSRESALRKIVTTDARARRSAIAAKDL